MGAIFLKKGKKMLKKKGQYISKFGQNVQNENFFLNEGIWLHAIIAHNELLD